ncbi:MAG: hypothetical protein BWY06_03197 [Candidatus Latescibacteria bacterium ADurb.Bin168]|nr:MAG: hypothetical protein BWY06_03197 [Candidatus Latescibacteria bacterium ADurb.Bin168]
MVIIQIIPAYILVRDRVVPQGGCAAVCPGACPPQSGSGIDVIVPRIAIRIPIQSPAGVGRHLFDPHAVGPDTRPVRRTVVNFDNQGIVDGQGAVADVLPRRPRIREPNGRSALVNKDRTGGGGAIINVERHVIAARRTGPGRRHAVQTRRQSTKSPDTDPGPVRTICPTAIAQVAGGLRGPPPDRGERSIAVVDYGYPCDVRDFAVVRAVIGVIGCKTDPPLDKATPAGLQLDLDFPGLLRGQRQRAEIAVEHRVSVRNAYRPRQHQVFAAHVANDECLSMGLPG